MPIADSLLTWIHLLSASMWVGGTILVGKVLAPMLKSLANTVEERIIFLIKICSRFNMVAVPALTIFVTPGIITRELS